LVLGGFLASDDKGKEMMKDQIKEEDIKERAKENLRLLGGSINDE